MFKLILKFFCSIACNIWWPFWSTIRWFNHRDDVDILDSDKVSSIEDIQKLVENLYNKFCWTADGADQLWDSICPPPYNYKRYLTGDVYDDCDGFHSLVYHCLQKSGIECYLLSVIARKSSHCVLIFKLDDMWYVDDYNCVFIHSSDKNIKTAIDNYNELFVKIYNAKSEVIYNSLTKYDYDKKVFKPVSIKSLTNK